MGEEDEGGGVGVRGAASGAEVADVVGVGFEIGLAEPPGEEGVGVAGGGREEEASGFVGDVGDEGELAAAGDDGGGAGGEGVGHAGIILVRGWNLGGEEEGKPWG